MKKFLPPRVILALILIAAAGLMLYSSFNESAIMDELAHIPAGYSYVSKLDYRLNPEHPPLVKALAALPLLTFDLNFPTNDPAWSEEVNGQWDTGIKFLYQSGNDPDLIIRLARIFPILLTLLLILLVYHISRKKFGSYWALLPATLTAFSPVVLAHGHYVTTDVGASLGILLALWRFAEMLKKDPIEVRDIWLAGLALGIAALLKFSAVLLLPCFAVLTLVHFIYRKGRSLIKEIGLLVAVFAIAYLLVVYPVYTLFTARYPATRQISDTRELLGSFKYSRFATETSCGGWGCLADLDIKMSEYSLTRPAAEYLLGVLMVKQRSDSGNTAYFLGKVSSSGSHWYFPVAYLTKETLPALIIILLSLCLAVRQLFLNVRHRNIISAIKNYLRNSFLEFSLLVFTILYWAYSISSPLNIGIRHILPTIPLLYILATSGWKRWNLGTALKTALLSLLLLWTICEAVIVSPHFLSYYNELAHGTANGYKLIDDSNYDWGQDMLALKKLAEENPRIDKIAVDYFGGGNASYYLGGKALPWDSAKGDPRAQGVHWLAISANVIQEATQPTALGHDRKDEDSYIWLTKEFPREPGMGGIPKPDLIAGTSIFIYHLP